MLASEFKRLWVAYWPHAALPNDELWRDVWAPLVKRAETKDAKRFLQRHRATGARGQFPPEPHDFASTLDLIKKPKPSGQRGETKYLCDFCDFRVTGTLAFDRHVDAEHQDEIKKGRDAGLELLKDWHKARKKEAPDV